MPLLLTAATVLAACSSSVRVPGPTGGASDVPPNYPTTVVESAAHRDAARAQWTQLFESYGVPPERRKPPELAPFTHTPTSILGGGPIPLVAAAGAAVENEEGTRLLVREFIAKHADLLGVAAGSLSLENVANAGQLGTRYTFVQAGAPFPIAAPAGRIDFVVSPKAEIIQINDTAIPVGELPATPRIAREAAEKLVLGKTFTYGDIAGRERSVTISDAAGVKASRLVVYARETEAALTIHLAWEVEAGSGGMTWTVYVDAVTGEVVGTRQNFQT